ncbi:MAG: ribosome maturation factor RimP [Acidimicrobiia bacterium]
MSTVAERVESLARPILADLGLDLYDLEYTGGVVRITVDRPGGVDLGAIADVTRMVSRELDHVDPIESRYTLEVSSPGLERTLRTADHFRRARGMTANVKLLAGTEGPRRVEGVISSSDEHEVVLMVDGAEKVIAFHTIEKAKTVFVWGGQPKPSDRAKAAAMAKKGAGAKGASGGTSAAPAHDELDEGMAADLIDDPDLDDGEFDDDFEDEFDEDDGEFDDADEHDDTSEDEDTDEDFENDTQEDS